MSICFGRQIDVITDDGVGLGSSRALELAGRNARGNASPGES